MNQMPIVDGLTSTKMIRSFEKTHPGYCLSEHAAHHGRVPIIAVSASLIEKDRQTYIEAGFDGWILKPIDFKRLNVLLSGILDEDTRGSCLYTPGGWERGGWFVKRRQPDSLDASSSSTTPTNATTIVQPSLASISISPPVFSSSSPPPPSSLPDEPISQEQATLKPARD